MKKELLAELNGYIEAVKTHNAEFGSHPNTTASVTLEGFATYLDTGKVHESDKRTLAKLNKEQDKALETNQKNLAALTPSEAPEPSN